MYVLDGVQKKIIPVLVWVFCHVPESKIWLDKGEIWSSSKRSKCDLNKIYKLSFIFLLYNVYYEIKFANQLTKRPLA